jgi:arylsulfatase A-like enzyme
VLHVPFIARLPGRIPAGKRISEPVSLIDLHPTILDFGGVTTVVPTYRGESLMEPILNGDMAYAGEGQMQFVSIGAGEDFNYDELFSDFNTQFQDIIEGGLTEKPEGRVIFAEDLYHFDKTLESITIGEWKYIHSPNRFHAPSFPHNQAIVPTEGDLPHDFIEGDELYNVADDPHELKNVVYDYPDIARYLYTRLMVIDYYNSMAASYRKSLKGRSAEFGAGLKNLTKGFGYW